MLNNVSLIGTISEESTEKKAGDLDITEGVIKVKGGTKKKPRDMFLEVTTFGNTAKEFAAMPVGSVVGMAGRLDTNYWRDENDKDIFIVAEKVYLVSTGAVTESTAAVEIEPDDDGQVPF